MTTNRFRISLVCYAVLAAGAAMVLSGDVRTVTWIFLGGLAVKSWAVYQKEKLDR